MPDTDLMGGLDALITQVRDQRDGEIAALETAKAALGGQPAVERRPPTRKARPRKTAKPKASKPSRREQIEALVKDRPGIKASFIANELGTKASYVHAVLGQMKADGVVKKDGANYYPQPQAA